MPVAQKTVKETGYNKLRKAADDVWKLGPGPAQWSAVHDLLWSLNPWEDVYNDDGNRIGRQSYRNVYALCVADNKRIRGTRENDFASSKSKSWRYAMAAPGALVRLWEAYDPMILHGPDAKKNLAKLRKVFPELFIPKRF